MVRKKFETKNSLSMKLDDIKFEYDSEGRRTNLEEVNARSITMAQKLKYNLLRQKLLLEALMEIGICNNSEYPYKAIIEETPCTSLSMSRLIVSGQISMRDVDNWYLISEDFYRINPFGVWLGAQGKVTFHNGQTKIIGNDLDFMTGSFKGICMTGMPYRPEDALLVVHGCSFEHAFSLCDSEYDIVFCDILSEFDNSSFYNYRNLYNHLKDICENRINCSFKIEPEVRWFSKSEKSFLCKSLIYCSKNRKIQRW